MPPKDSDDTVWSQLQAGRLVPWELEKKVLESNTDRPDRSMEDPDTRNMQIWDVLNGTRTTLMPKAFKQTYIRELQERNRVAEEAAKQNSDVHMRIRGLGIGQSQGQLSQSKWAQSFRSTASRKTLPDGKFGPKPADDEMTVTCRNCDGDGHDTQKCPSACRECGRSMRQHGGLNRYKLGCMCREHPGHTKNACDRPCRLCFIESRESTTKIKDCVMHCQLHMRGTENNNDALNNCDRGQCLIKHEDCPSCHTALAPRLSQLAADRLPDPELPSAQLRNALQRLRSHHEGGDSKTLPEGMDREPDDLGASAD